MAVMTEFRKFMLIAELTSRGLIFVYQYDLIDRLKYSSERAPRILIRIRLEIAGKLSEKFSFTGCEI